MKCLRKGRQNRQLLGYLFLSKHTNFSQTCLLIISIMKPSANSCAIFNNPMTMEFFNHWVIRFYSHHIRNVGMRSSSCCAFSPFQVVQSNAVSTFNTFSAKWMKIVCLELEDAQGQVVSLLLIHSSSVSFWVYIRHNFLGILFEWNAMW